MSAYTKIKKEYTPDEKQQFWDLANGLQAVAGIQPSDYLLELQKKEIAGEITLEEVKRKIERCYGMDEKMLTLERITETVIRNEE